jgi:hypothetical protein
MLAADINKIPKIGEYVVMENSVHGELERLKAVLILPDDIIPNTMHVFFASDEPSDNIYEENGVKYYSIRTYTPIPEEE